MNQNNKPVSNTDIRNTLFCEVGIGILANTILLLFHIAMWARGHRPRPTDLPISLLALSHLMMLIVMGFIATDIFTSPRGWDDITCKSLIYVHRLLRGLSLCVTCLLSILQAITLSSRSSCLAKFKHTSPHHNLCSLLVLCIIYASISSHIFMSIIAAHNLTSDNLMYVTESCFILPMSSSIQHTFSTMLVFRDLFLIGLMVVSSVYMAILLCRHRKESQHLHSTSLSPKAAPEIRATQTILLLMGFFVVMSVLDSSISYSRTMFHGDPTLYCTQILVAHGYATVGPLVIISSDKHILNFLKSMCERTVDS